METVRTIQQPCPAPLHQHAPPSKGRALVALRLIVSLSIVTACAAGCVTPQTVKEASTQHAANLNKLEQTAKLYRDQMAADYDRRVQLQKQAYVAQSMSRTIDKDVEELAKVNVGKVEDTASRDFISYASRLREELIFFGNHFDYWLTLKGDTLAAKIETLKTNDIASLQAEIDKLKSENRDGISDRIIRLKEKALAGLKATVSGSPSDLTHVTTAIEIANQKAQRLSKLDVLIQQIKVMQSFHAVIDDYLAIDATIDGAAIAKAAAAGSKFDLSGLPEMQKVLNKVK